MGEKYEMKCHQRELLISNRNYLMRNIYPVENFWAALIETGTLTPEMVEEIKVRHFQWNILCKNQCLNQMIP